MATPVRFLQRRLAFVGTSYQAVLDSIRREAAGKYLIYRALSIPEVGYLLGYSEPAAFYRAFKRWNGSTPQEFGSRIAHRLKSTLDRPDTNCGNPLGGLVQGASASVKAATSFTGNFDLLTSKLSHGVSSRAPTVILSSPNGQEMSFGVLPAVPASQHRRFQF
jgi:helix-turn-helix protein